MVRIHSGIGLPISPEDDVTAYLKDIGDSTPLSREEEARLAERIRSGDRRALNALVQANLRFVVAVCGKYRGRGLPMGDLINEGNLGLLRAAERFDGKVGVRFISYAVWWVRQGVESALAAQGRLFPLTNFRAGRLRKAERAARSLAQTLGREATREEIARAAGIGVEELEACRGASEKPFSLEASGEGRADLVDDPAAGRTPQGAEAARRWVLRGILEDMLGDLSARDREMVRLYHGLGGETGYSARDLGRRFNLSRRSVGAILRRAEAALRRSPEAKELREAAILTAV